MDASLCREHLAQLLTEEGATLERLEALLEKEHGFITANDVEALDSAGAERQLCVIALMRIDDERRSLCRASGMSSDLTGLKKLLAWCDQDGGLQTRWSQCAVRIRHCRSMNDRNGALVNNRLKRVEGLLDILNGSAAKESRVYTARGNAYAAANAGRVLNAQV